MRADKILTFFLLFFFSSTPGSFFLYGNEVIFRTGFEPSEGYEPIFDLGGINGWVGSNAGGSGIPEDTFFEGEGQQAFIGFSPFDQLSEQNFSLFLWNPINFIPAENENPILEFNVTFQILDSGTGGRDDFRWSFFNTENTRLFTLDFDNLTLRLNYVLGSNSDFIETRTSFTNTNIYQLKVRMDFKANAWSCWIDEILVIENELLFEEGVAQSLGDVSAIWAVKDSSDPGDNFMVFDNYEILKINTLAEEPVLQVNIVRRESGALLLKANASIESQWIIQGSDDLEKWNFLTDVTLTPDGSEWLLNQDQEKGFWRIIPK